jgi:formylglycine-generating enzyme required for sulfatase activity
MVYIPPGPFMMGATDSDQEDRSVEFGIAKPWFQDELPAHPVKLPGFFMDQHEVVNDDYRRFAQETGRALPTHWLNGLVPAGKGRHPVTHVTYQDAEAYCHWAGKRLPTEPEWERAARGTDGRLYPWGSEFDSKRANGNDEVGDTTPVGQYEAGKSPEGVYDLVGNVWEWTADWYQPYPGSDYRSPKFGQVAKVLRGNSWAGLGHYPPEIKEQVKAHYSRASFRMFLDPLTPLNDVGFRCARSLS